MAKTPPAAADAPVLDDSVDMAAVGDAASKKRFSLKLPKLPVALSGLLGRLPLPKIMLSKKLVVVLAAAFVAVGVAGGATYALWPTEQPKPEGLVVKKKAKRPKHGASSAMAAASDASSLASAVSAASAASAGAEPVVAAASQAGDSPHAGASAPSEPEDAMDKIRRRLAEATGGRANLKPDGPGELRLTARLGTPVAAPAHSPRTAEHGHEAANVERVARLARGEDSAGLSAIFNDRPAAHGSAAQGGSSSHAHWSYEGPDGPDAWAHLRPEYAKCSTGSRQSPIDIRDGFAVQLDPVKFDYKPSAFSVIDNGHTVQVKVAPGNFIEVSGHRFELQQFHFHRPSEERIAGKQFDMVAHLVHKDADGRLAVVAVLLERGGAQPVVQSVWNNLPLEKGDEQAANAPIDLNQLLPTERGYFTYMGSLTTPPCSEGVQWMVMKQPVPVSADQIGIFARLYPMNARPIQSASGRIIKESN